MKNIFTLSVNGNFKTVTVNKFETEAGVLTRIDVELVKDMEAILSASPAYPGELRVTFPALEELETVQVIASETVKPLVADLSPVKSAQPDSFSVADLDKPYRILTDITTRDNTILLALDGTIKEFKAFRLNNPERYVIDLMDVQSALATRFGADNLSCHFHDTRSMGVANVYAAIEAGIRRFDASIGGLGGCPFAPGATGNVATEDVVLLVEHMGFSTGIDMGARLRASDLATGLTGTARGGNAKAWLQQKITRNQSE